MYYFNFIMFEFAYRMTQYHSKKFHKWSDIFKKYSERLKV